MFGVNPRGGASFNIDVKKEIIESMIKLLIENGADLTLQTKEGNTPLHIAINKYYPRSKYSNHLIIFKILN